MQAPQLELIRSLEPGDIRGVGHDDLVRQNSAACHDCDLKWSRKCLGGLRRDIARNLPYYKSDFVDAFVDGNFSKTTASIAFLFFATLSPALAFGASYSSRMNGDMGVEEAIVSTAMSGMVFALLSGQPLNVIGATGPKFAFMSAFYDLCVSTLDVDFLVARLWLGLWTALFLFLFAVFEASCLMQWASRFMEEIFALYIGVIFVVQALEDIFGAADRGTDAGFLTIMLGLGTTFLIIQFKEISRKRVLNLTMRNAISNFAVALAIIIVSVVANLAANGEVNLLFINVPTDFSPSRRDRSWFISPWGNEGLNSTGERRPFPVSAALLMALPGIGFALLNFMDQNTTALLVNRPANGIKKPVGYHLDLLVLSIIYVPCAFLGLIFPAGSTVPAITHVISLTTYTERELPGGGVQKIATKVVEQRWTGFIIHLLIGLSLLAAPALAFVPKAVLYGVFLYMGLSSRQGNQLWDRLTLWLNFEPSTYPRLPYATRVRTRRMHLYTLIQAVLLGCVYGLTRVRQTGVLFPFFVAGLVPFRVFVLPKIFTEEELEVLDAHQDLPPDERTEAESKPTEPTELTADPSEERDSEVARSTTASVDLDAV
jgi:hypothetical protein